MLWKRIALGIAATGITCASVYGADQYFNNGQLIGGAGQGQSQPIKIAESPEIDPALLETDCGLTNGPLAASSQQAPGALSANATRARVVAGRMIDRSEEPAKMIEAGDCRYRLDGVWVEDRRLAFDTSANSDVARAFGDINGGQADPSLAHGTYVKRRIILIDAADDGSSFTISDAFGEAEPIKAIAADDVPMENVFTPGGSLKVYNIADAPPEQDDEIMVDVTSDGEVRVRIDGVNYYRPAPNPAERGADLAAVDPFMIHFNLDNLAASRRGYDVVTQDPIQLNINDRGEVFEAADPLQYAVVEKRTVPLGLKLVPEGASGSIVSSTLIRTEREFQSTIAWNVGANVGTGLNPTTGEPANSVGVNYAQSNTDGMRNGSANAITMGAARHKLYALVLDEPFARLSREFERAVDDARRYGRYAELIEKFGTHYPYAMTYGSAFRMRAEFEEETVARWLGQSQDLSVNAKATIKAVQINGSGGISSEEKASDSYLSQSTREVFRAVGGTGSYSPEGNATGIPYPILADLRPLHELLNPLNFPGQPEVYGEVRERLRDEISNYLARNSRSLSDRIPETQVEYKVQPFALRCDQMPKKTKKLSKQIDLVGSFGFKSRGGGSVETIKGGGNPVGDLRGVRLKCTGGDRGTYNFPSNWGFLIKGRRSRLPNTKFSYDVDFDFRWVTPIPKKRDLTGDKNNFGEFTVPTQYLKPGETKDITVTIASRTNERPKVVLISRVTRVK
ncbi:MAG: MAC/perforin domain-containing protein [Pseudomonadota bacterium]